MNIPIIDRSNYLKGLFIVAKLDGSLTQYEKDFLKKISEQLGFSKDFYDETVRNLMRNKYIKDEKIKFSSKEIALSFIEDALNIATSDGSLAEPEKKWFTEMAELNGIEIEELNKKINQVKINHKPQKIALLSII